MRSLRFAVVVPLAVFSSITAWTQGEGRCRERPARRDKRQIP